MTRNGLIYAIGNFANSLALFLLIPYLVRVFPAATYGAWVQIELLLGLLGLLTAAGLEAGLQRYTAHEPDEQRRRRVVGTLFLLIGLNAGVIFALLLLIGPHLPGSLLGLSDAQLPPRLLLLIGLASLVEVLFSLTLNVLRARRRAVPFVTLNFIKLLLTVIGVIGGISSIGGLNGGMFGRVIAGLLPLIAALWLIRRSIAPALDRQLVRMIVSYGLPMLLFNLAVNLLYAADRALLQALASLEVAALYSFAYKIASLPDVLITRPFALDWAPRRFLLAAAADAPQRFGAAILHYLLLAGSGSLFVLAATPLAYRLFAPPEYRAAMASVPLLIAAYLAFGLSTMLNNGPFLRDRTRDLPPLSSIALLAYLLLLVLLIPPFGMIGAALATVSAYTLLAVLLARLSQRLYPIALPWPRLITTAGLLFGGGLALQVVGPQAIDDNVQLLLRGVVAAVAALLAARAALGPLLPQIARLRARP